MSDDLVKQARASLEGVTPGPWKSASQGGDSTILAPTLPPRNERRSEVGYGYRDENGFCVGYPFLDCKNETRMDFVCFGHADANFIAASRQLVPVMADRIEALEAQLADLRLELLSALGEAWANLDRAVKAEAQLAAMRKGD